MGRDTDGESANEDDGHSVSLLLDMLTAEILQEFRREACERVPDSTTVVSAVAEAERAVLCGRWECFGV